MITQELLDACEFAKTAADMSIPVEPMPTPEPGSEAIDGMVNGSMMDPNSVGAGTYAGAVDQAALAQAKARAAAAAQAAAAQKTAAIEEAYVMGYEDAVAEFEEMNKMASVEDAYEMGYAAAMEELEKIAADAYMVIDGQPVKMPDLTARERGEIAKRYKNPAPKMKSKGVSNAIERNIDKSILQNSPKPNATVENLKAGINNLKGEVRSQKAGGQLARKAKGVATVAGGLAAGMGAKYGLHKYLANKRKAKMTRNGMIGAGAAAALAGLGYAAHKARD